MNYIIFNFHPIQMSINDLPDGLFTHGSIQVRGIDDGGIVTEHNQLPSIIVPYQPNNVIVRRNRMASEVRSSYTVTATCDIGSDVRLEYIHALTGNITPIHEIEIGSYGRFTHTFNTPTTSTPYFYLSMTNGELSGRSDVPVIITIEVLVLIHWQNNSVELLPSTSVEIEDVEVSLDGGITWNYWTELSNDVDRIPIQDGLYLQGSIQTRRRIGNQVGDALPLGYNLIVPYQPLVTNIIRSDTDNYIIHGISIPNTEVRYVNPMNQEQSGFAEVDSYGMFTITLVNYEYESVDVALIANNNSLPTGFIEVELT